MRSMISSLALLAVAACASGPTGPEASSRFDSFEAVETNDFTSFDKVYIAMPVPSEELRERTASFSTTILRDERPLSERDLNELLSELQDDLSRAVGQQAELVDAPGEGVLTISTVVTKLESNRPTQAELARNPSLSFRSVYAGGAAVVYELSENGRLLATITDSDNAPPLNTRAGGPAGVWGTVDQFYQQTSRRMADLITG